MPAAPLTFLPPHRQNLPDGELGVWALLRGGKTNGEGMARR